MPSKKSVKYCPECGEKSTKKAKFCMECGFNFQEMDENPTKESDNKSYEKNLPVIDEEYDEIDEDNDETKCPVCNTYMMLIEEKRKRYHFCPICEIEFKEDKNQLVLTSAPKDTRIYRLYKNKTKPWIEWKNIGLLNYMPEEEEELLKFNKIDDTDILCPACESGNFKNNLEIFS